MLAKRQDVVFGTLLFQEWLEDTFTIGLAVGTDQMLVLFDIDWEGILREDEWENYHQLPPEEWV